MTDKNEQVNISTFYILTNKLSAFNSIYSSIGLINQLIFHKTLTWYELGHCQN